MRIRQALPADVPAMQRVSVRAYDEYERRLGYTPHAASEDVAKWVRNGRAWVGEHASEVMAVLLVEPKDGHLHVFSAAVDPAWQGQGHGTELLDHAAMLAKDAGLAEVRLTTNTKMDRNIALYTHCGFQVVGQTPHPAQASQALAELARRV